MDFLNENAGAFMIGTGGATLLFASALAYVFLGSRRKSQQVSVLDASIKSSTKEVIIDKEEYPGGQISVYYATQTGTSESFARQLEREGPEHGFFVHVVDLEDIEVEDMMDEARRDADSGTARAIFLTATYGEGEAPDNATAFVQTLCEKAGTEILFEDSKAPDLTAPESCLVGLDYCVFGLGNRQYDHYNAMGKFFDHAIGRLGGNRILECGLGDDDSDLEGDFESWKDNKLWPTLEKLYLSAQDQVRERKTTKAASIPDSQYVIEYHAPNEKARDIPPEKIHSSSRHYFTSHDCPIKVVRELRSPKDGGSTLHVEVDISNAKGLCYTTADNLGVLPMNDPSIVESVAKSLGYDLDQVFSVKASPHHEWHGAPFPMPITIRECLTRYCDLTSAPRRSDLKLLAAFATDPVDQKALLRMASKEGKVEYREKILDDYVGLVDLLKRCPSISLPLANFLEICPLMQTRFYTISSSSSVHPSTIHLTVAVTRADRKDGSVFKGVCSNFLAGCKPQEMIRIYSRPSTFRLPEESTKPIIMIGPGTGIAPMRALLQERSFQRRELNKQVGRNILYFGCRKASLDYIYEDELKQFVKDGDLDELHVAFSRENSTKVYVQHLLTKNAQDTWKLLDTEGAFVYVCGGVRMGHDVSEALKEIVCTQGGLTPENAKEYMSQLTKQGRLVQELWA